MKRIIILGILVFLFVGCSKSTGSNSDNSLPKWTVLAHFAIDNNIDYGFEDNNKIVTNYLNTLEKVKKFDKDNVLNIVVMLDCYGVDSQGAGYTSRSFADGYYILSGDFEKDFLEKSGAWKSIEEIKSGNVQDSKDFIDYALKNCEAEKYLYTVFDHGGGFSDTTKTGVFAKMNLSIGFDDNAGSGIVGDVLTHSELGEITEYLQGKIDKKIDLFYAYACLMGGVELAYEVRNNVDYILFSEETFPAEMWSYEALESILDKPDIESKELAVNFCKSALLYFDDFRSFTLSVVDLSKMDELYNAINNVATNMVADISTNENGQDYDCLAINSLSSFYVSYYLDLGDYMKNISESSLPFSVRSKAKDVEEAINNAVVYKTYANNFEESPLDYSKATGLTIYHNKWYDVEKYKEEHYKDVLSFADNKWYNYMRAMNNSSFVVVSADSYEADSYENRENLVIGSSSSRSFHQEFDKDYFVVELDSAVDYRLELKSDQIMYYDLYLYGSSYYSGACGQMVDFTALYSGDCYIDLSVFSTLGNYEISIKKR